MDIGVYATECANCAVEPSIGKSVVNLTTHSTVAEHRGNDVQRLKPRGRYGGNQVVKTARLNTNALQKFVQRLVAEHAEIGDAGTVKNGSNRSQLLLGNGDGAKNVLHISHVCLDVGMPDTFTT